MRQLKRNRHGTRAAVWCSAVLVCVMAAPVMATDAPDEGDAPEEQESPALRKPMPELSAPADSTPDVTEFSRDAPPPPPFDPSYQPPMSGAPAEGATK